MERRLKFREIRKHVATKRKNARVNRIHVFSLINSNNQA